MRNFSGEPFGLASNFENFLFCFLKAWIVDMMIRIHEGICMISVATVSSPDLLSVCVGLKPTKVWNVSHLMLRLLPLKSSTNSTWTYPPIFCYQKKVTKWTDHSTFSQGPVAKECAELWPKIASCAPAICWVERNSTPPWAKKTAAASNGLRFGSCFFKTTILWTPHLFFSPHIIFFVKHLKSIQAQPS